jgi:hypothetical protein
LVIEHWSYRPQSVRPSAKCTVVNLVAHVAVRLGWPHRQSEVTAKRENNAATRNSTVGVYAT